MQGYPPPPPNQPPGPPGGPPPGPPYGSPGSPYGYGAPPPSGGYGGGPPGMMMMNPHAPYGIEPITGRPYSDKQKLVAGLLQIFLGAFGVGRFYTGHIGIAVAQILVTWLTCVGFLWPLIDGVMMLTGNVTDSEGRPLRDS